MGINISAAKRIRRDICRTMGHDFESLSVPQAAWAKGNSRCTRCKKLVWSATGGRIILPTFDASETPKIKYSELQTKRFNILDRMRKRAGDGDKT